MRTSRGASAREVGSEDGDLSHRSKYRGGVVKVGRVEVIVRRERVLRRERRWATGEAVPTVHRPVSARSLLDVGEMALKYALPVIGVQCEDHCKEDEDLRAKRAYFQWWGIRVGRKG